MENLQPRTELKPASPSVWKSYRRLSRYLRPYRCLFFMAILAMVIFGASDGFVPYLIKEILDGIFSQQNKALLYSLPPLLVAFALVRGTADFIQQYTMAKVGHFIVRDLRNEINRHLLSLSPDFFVHRSSADLVARNTSDVLLVRTLLTDSLAAIIRDSIRLVALFISAIYMDWVLALIAFVGFPVAIFPVYRFGKRMRRLSRTGQDAISTLGAITQESAVGNRVVKIFGQEEFEQQRFERANDALTKTFIKAERIKAMTGPINEVLATSAIAGVILYGGFSVLSGLRSQGDFIAFLVAVFLMYDPFKKLSRISSNVQQAIAGAERVFDILDTQSSIAEAPLPRGLPTSNTIVFDQVSFVYKRTGMVESQPPALQNINLTIQEGSKVALVGLSGAGKSTLTDLIARFIDPSSGTVTIGGVDLRQVSLKELRARIAIVGQHTFLFNDSIFNNLRYGKPGASREEIETAARLAHAYEFIQAMPQGFDTVVGESGMTLSGGERQRLAIARAILKDAPILILDEATASLDNRSEREVQLALDTLSRDRTTIIIAHRLSTIKDADVVVVMRDGSIVEVGSHEELLGRGGEFLSLYRLQFSESVKQLNA